MFVSLTSLLAFARVQEASEQSVMLEKRTLCGTWQVWMGSKKICGRVWLLSLNAPQIFFLTVHFCMRDSRMWQHIILPLPAGNYYLSRALPYSYHQ